MFRISLFTRNPQTPNWRESTIQAGEHTVKIRAIIDPTMRCFGDEDPDSPEDVGGYKLQTDSGGLNREVYVFSSSCNLATDIQRTLADKYKEIGSPEQAIDWLLYDSEYSTRPSKEYNWHCVVEREMGTFLEKLSMLRPDYSNEPGPNDESDL